MRWPWDEDWPERIRDWWEDLKRRWGYLPGPAIA